MPSRNAPYALVLLVLPVIIFVFFLCLGSCVTSPGKSSQVAIAPSKNQDNHLNNKSKNKSATQRCLEEKHAIYCLAQGHFLLREGTPKRASVWFTRACNLGSMDACSWLGERAATMREDKKAHSYFERGCQKGHGRSCVLLGSMYERGLMEGGIHLRKSLKLYKKACKQGSATGCSNQATATLHGRGTLRHPRRAHDLYMHACTQGKMHACMRASWLISRQCLGDSRISCARTSTDLAQLVRWLGSSCEDDQHSFSCVAYAAYLEQGRGISPNPERAAMLYEDACLKDVAWGCHGLARVHRRGLGIPASPKQAVKLFEQSCAMGFLSSCHVVGRMHLEGVEVEVNVAQAKRSLERACTHGMQRSCAIMLARCASGHKAMCPDSSHKVLAW